MHNICFNEADVMSSFFSLQVVTTYSPHRLMLLFTRIRKLYLSNGFTRAFQGEIIEQPDVTLRDLFYHVVRQTAGSHASLYNYKNYGNIYTERLGEMVCREAK